MISNNKTSHLISSQVPQFVRDDHPKFVVFLEKYYSFLEQSGQLLDETKNITNNLNIDLANEASKEKLYKQFIDLLSKNIVGDRDLILKYAKDFYRSKGSENAIRFIIRNLYNKEIEFYYPKTDILRASDGKWFVEKSLKITDVAVDNVANSIGVNNFVNKIVRGATTNATAIVESVDIYYDKGDLVTELKLSSTKKDFLSGEQIYTTFTEDGVDRRLSANLFSGSIVAITIDNPGTGYTVGNPVQVVSNTGFGAELIVSEVTTGNLKSVGILSSGAGFQTFDDVLISGDGTGANVYVFQVDNTGKYHPNTYSVVGSTISLEANTPLNNAVFTNLNSTNANSSITNAFSYWSYSNCGPLLLMAVRNSGTNYSTLPVLDVRSNTVIRSLGILGKMEIKSGGLNYQIGDTITFTNPIGGYGSGASANVTNVDANGAITEIKFVQIDGHITGGSGYNKDLLPTATVNSATGNGANITVTSIIGDNESLKPVTDKIGAIQRITIINPGRGYTTVPTLNLSSYGDGTAQATAFITTGVFSYPGRFINDDGHLSSYNFLEDRDYYQNFSYVIKLDESLSQYRKYINELSHPSGTKLFGEYTFRDTQDIDIPITSEIISSFYLNGADYQIVYKRGTYEVQSTNVTHTPVIYNEQYSLTNTSSTVYYEAVNRAVSISLENHGYTLGDTVYLSFEPNTSSNLINAMYQVSLVTNANIFAVVSYTSVGANIVNGNVTVYNPMISITPVNGVTVGQNVKLVFSTSDTSLANAVYTVKSANGNSFIVLHSNIAFATSLSGNANLITNRTVVTYNSHPYTANSNVYMIFKTGDTGNTTNGLYNIANVTQNTFDILTPNFVFDGGNAAVVSKTITINLPYHNYSNTENIQIWFTSGDVSNATNGIYAVNIVDSNTLTINSSSYVERDGNVTIYSNNSNIIVTKASHGLIANDEVGLEFVTGDVVNIANDVFAVQSVIDNNTFIINHRRILISNAVVFTETSNTGAARLGIFT